jgi:hypothetical protein
LLGDAESGGAGASAGVLGRNDAGPGVWGQSNTGPAVYASGTGTDFSGAAVVGVNNNDGKFCFGMYGHGIGALGHGVLGIGEFRGVWGMSDSGDGVQGQSVSSSGVFGVSGTAEGVRGVSISGPGVYAYSYQGLAAWLNGNIQVSGSINKSATAFKIDHPLDPANRYLYHSGVESPDMKNIYDGILILDQQGEATIDLPNWFGALNSDFRYQLTAVGASAPNLHIAQEVNSANRFKIAGGTPKLKVCWQVTGIRHDAFANAHRIPLEEKKSGHDRGRYLHPELFGQPLSRRIDVARPPERLEAAKELIARIKPAMRLPADLRNGHQRIPAFAGRRSHRKAKKNNKANA